MHDGVVVLEEVDLINSELLGVHLLDQVLNNLVV